MSGERGYVKKANLLPTMPISWYKIVMRVRNSVLDVYLSNEKDSKGIGPVWKTGDTILCREHHKMIQGI